MIGSYLYLDDALSLLPEEKISTSFDRREKLTKDRHDLLYNNITKLVEVLEGLSSNPHSTIRKTASYYSYKIMEFQAIVFGMNNVTSLLAALNAWETLENSSREDIDHQKSIQSDHAGEAAMIYFQLFETMTAITETLEYNPMRFLCGIIAGDESLRIFGLRWSMSQGLGRSIHSGVFDNQVYETSAADQDLVAPKYIIETISARIELILQKLVVLEKIVYAQSNTIIQFSSIEEMQEEVQLSKCVNFFSGRHNWTYDYTYFIDISENLRRKLSNISNAVSE